MALFSSVILIFLSCLILRSSNSCCLIRSYSTFRIAARCHYCYKNCFLSCSNYSFNSCLYSMLFSFIEARIAASLFILSCYISNSFRLIYALRSFCMKLSTCDLINISEVSFAVVIFRSISNRFIDDSFAF